MKVDKIVKERQIVPSEPKLLAGKTALVTGGSRGVGLGIAKALALDGCNVAVNCKDEGSLPEAEQVAKELIAMGVDSFAVVGDVSDSASVKVMFDAVSRRFEKLDLLVNNAGIQVWKRLLETTDEDWDAVIATNLRGCFLCTRAAGHLMKAQGFGSIVNIGSGCNKAGFPRLVSYVASKGAIEMFTKAAALELGPFGIRVNCVAPGAIVVERTLIDDPAYEETWGAVTPLRRAGFPSDVGAVVVFYASRYSEFVSGQTTWVDGGLFSQAPWPYKLD